MGLPLTEARLPGLQVKPNTPVLMCSVPGYDASGHVEDLAAEQNTQITSIAIGKGGRSIPSPLPSQDFTVGGPSVQVRLLSLQLFVPRLRRRL